MPVAVQPPILLGLTGNIACGKSTVLGLLAQLGAVTIDADRVYHELIGADAPLRAALVRRFGPTIVREDRSIDRRALAAIVFGDPTALAELDRITHPPIVAELRRRVRQSSSPLVAVDAVKLVESGFADECDAVWVVTCHPEQQIARLRARNGFTEREAAERVAAQPPAGATLDRADVLIANDGDLAATRQQVERALRSLLRRDSV